MDFTINPVELLGYIASLLVFLTFCMKTLVWLRVIAIASNVVFIAYGIGASLYPILILHVVLLPLNLFRLWQHVDLIDRVKMAAREDATAEALLPFMQSLNVEADQLLFERGDPADRLYYVVDGSISIAGVENALGPGDIFGEIGLFSKEATRTATARADVDSTLCTIERETVLRLYVEHPLFGLAITRLIVGRLVDNQKTLRAQLAQAAKGNETDGGVTTLGFGP